MQKKLFLAVAVLIICSSHSDVNFGNQLITSFSKSKKLLEDKVFYDNKTTLYCNASYTDNKDVILPLGVECVSKTCKKIEWEHIIPAENFGRNFSSWRNGDKRCYSKSGKKMTNRQCAAKIDKEFNLMHADMYNLYPAIGAVNRTRKNYNFTMLDDNIASSFGSCQFKVSNNKVQPPESSRGIIARTHLYFDAVYPKFNLSKQQRQLMQTWDKMYPVTQWECLRAQRIESIQKNENPILKKACKEYKYI